MIRSTLILAVACASVAAADGGGPSCPGVELGITERDAMAELLLIFCTANQGPTISIEGCLELTLGNWCPATADCGLILCGAQLQRHADCLVVALAARDGVTSQACLDFYTGLSPSF